MAKKREVALIVETSSPYGRRILRGITRYLRAHQHWYVYLEQRALTTKLPPWLSNWESDGIISRCTTKRLLERVRSAGIPFVELTDRGDLCNLPHLWSDDRAIGLLAATHLLERGFRQFAFCGFSREAWSQRRRDGFVAAIERAGFEVAEYESSWLGRETSPWENQQRQLADWLSSLPQPLGIMACNDVRGQHVLDVCNRIGAAVPEDIAVIGVDDDQLLCNLCNPPLTSVIPNPEQIGYRAAELLDRLMSGKNAADGVGFLVEPLGITTRQSTDTLAIDNPQVANAVRFIREHACQGITVDDVLRQVHVSRSVLERLFRKYLNRSPQMTIRSVQLKRVKQLLSETDFPLARVARMVGFEHPEYMSVVFKRETGQTPGQFRSAASH